ncbi:MAG: hypothetical protein RL748_695 [Pseudomonadota bacterium]|jgi:enoyl-CoA hydratase/carnithine racemase
MNLRQLQADLPTRPTDVHGPGAAAPVLFHTLPAKNGMQIGMATLNAENTLNALSCDMVRLLAAQLLLWESDPAIAMVVLQGAGERAFCAGGDLQNLYASMREHHASPRRGDVLGNACALQFFAEEYRLDYQIHCYRKPLLCWGHGIVMGGGIGLMAGASHRVVTERSRLALPEIGIGLFPDVGSSWLLNRMPGQLGLFLALTGAVINASDAKFVKLADFHLPHASLPGLLALLQQQDWPAGPTAVAQNRPLLSQILREQESLHVSGEPGPLRQHFDVINHLCSAPTLTHIVQQLTTLVSDDAWLNKAITNLRKACPRSIWLAYQLQQRSKHLSLAQVFRLELGVALACASGPEFVEGIRALLIDKDLRPQWAVPDLVDLTTPPATGAQPRSRQPDWFASPWSAADHPLRDLQELPISGTTPELPTTANI